MESDEGRKWLASGNVSAFMKRMNAISQLHRDELIDDFLRALESADLIVSGVLTEASSPWSRSAGNSAGPLHLGSCSHPPSSACLKSEYR